MAQAVEQHRDRNLAERTHLALGLSSIVLVSRAASVAPNTGVIEAVAQRLDTIAGPLLGTLPTPGTLSLSFARLGTGQAPGTYLWLYRHIRGREPRSLTAARRFPPRIFD